MDYPDIKIEGNSFMPCAECRYVELPTTGLVITGAIIRVYSPVVLSEGNVLFPEGWSEEQRREWRKANNVPGAEWRP